MSANVSANVSAKRGKWILLLIPIGVFLLADQAVQWTVLRDGYLRGRRIAPFDPPLFNATQEAVLERLRSQDPAEPLTGNVRFDPDLGWCVAPESGSGDYVYDRFGARVGHAPLAIDKAPGVRRLCVIGGSFTHGDEVTGVDAWPAILDRLRADWEVANLGVGGFGIDQAWMRFLRDGPALAADEVWLCVMPMALPRCLSVYRPALRHRELSIGFKPRYRLVEGALEAVPCPVRSIAELVRLTSDSSAFYAAVGETDAYVARWKSAYQPMGTRWTHWFATTRLILTRAEDNGRDPASPLADPSSELFRLTSAIVDAALTYCDARGIVFRVVLLPDGKALARRQEAGGIGFWERWLAELAGPTLDLSGPMVDAGVLSAGSEHWAPNGHYSPATNAWVAALLAEALPD